jgi:hypothetical protein
VERRERGPSRFDGCLTILFSNATAHIDDFAIESFHGYDKPFERNRFVGINRTPKLNPKFEAERRTTFGKVESG